MKASPTLAAIPITMMSGDSRVEMLMRSMEVGAAGFVVKPLHAAVADDEAGKVLKA